MNPQKSSSTIHLHDEPSSNKTRLLQRMISLRRSSSSKPATQIFSTHIPSTTSSCRSYNVRAFEIARDRNLRHYPCIIHFLDETERTFHIDRRCKGIDLLNEVFDYLDLSIERKYFGLLVEDLTQDFAYRWLDSTKTLKKQLTNAMSPFHLYFKVRFFLIDPATQIDDEFTKYLYVLQIKKELLSGKMWCPRSTAAVLASYLVQSTNLFVSKSMDLFGFFLFRWIRRLWSRRTSSRLFRRFSFYSISKYGIRKWCRTISQTTSVSKSMRNDSINILFIYRGQSPADAEMNYLRVVSSLDMYGVELHKASVKVNTTGK